MAEYKDLTAQLRLFETVCRHSEKPDIADLVRCAWKAIEELSSAGSIYGKAWTLGYDAGRDENMPRWIPATERLPETDGLYLVSVKNDHKRRYSKTAWYEKQSWFARQDVTHWMTLPQPPAQKEKS